MSVARQPFCNVLVGVMLVAVGIPGEEGLGDYGRALGAGGPKRVEWEGWLELCPEYSTGDTGSRGRCCFVTDMLCIHWCEITEYQQQTQSPN